MSNEVTSTEQLAPMPEDVYKRQVVDIVVLQCESTPRGEVNTSTSPARTKVGDSVREKAIVLRCRR